MGVISDSVGTRASKVNIFVKDLNMTSLHWEKKNDFLGCNAFDLRFEIMYLFERYKTKIICIWSAWVYFIQWISRSRINQMVNALKALISQSFDCKSPLMLLFNKYVWFSLIYITADKSKVFSFFINESLNLPYQYQ